VPGLGLGRDPERTPMQWDTSANAGFSDGDPWLPLASDFREVNVEAQRSAGRSMLSLYRALIALRRREPALAVGVHVKAEAIGSVLTYRRFHAGRWITVALNFAGEPQMFSKPHDQDAILISTHLDRGDRERGETVRLRANEGIVLAAA
jgi:alpha-glucosidase